MANQEHLDILKQGVETWNQWRRKHPDILLINLEGADFSGANLSGANLSSAILWGADFSGANLSGADLTRADLASSGANLSGANLSNANLTRADLSEVNLSDADLTRADLSGARLNVANLTRAIFKETILRAFDFHSINLIAVDLCGATLNDTDLTSADLTGANFRGATLRGATLSQTNLSGKDLSQIDLCKANLSRANLSGACLNGADLSEADLYLADLSDTDLRGATLRGATLSQTNLSGKDLSQIDFSRANLSRAQLVQANLTEANLVEANLQDAMLNEALLIKTNLQSADLSGCSIYGVSVWNARLEGAIQSNLIITSPDESAITVDNLEVAQFIYLLLNNQDIRQTIDTITSQVVLILGHFTNERKMVLEALRGELRNQNYSPVVFNFEGPDNKDFTETVRTLANMARFVLIDLTDLDDNIIREIAEAIIPRCVVPIRSLLLQGSHQQEYELFRELQQNYRWVLAPYRYKDLFDLHTCFQEKIIQPINEKIIELKQKKPLKIFIGYAPEDKDMLNELKIHLQLLERMGLIEIWDDQDVAPGEEKVKEIKKHLSDARIILLLISPTFLNSYDCYDIQTSIAIEQHKQGKARVIPIILRPCHWQLTPLLKELRPLPKDGKPISQYHKDDVFFEVSTEIGDVIKILR